MRRESGLQLRDQAWATSCLSAVGACRRRLRRFRRDDAGAVAVEAAIIYPTMVLLMLGTIEFGLLLFTLNTMQSAARDVARQVSLNFLPAASAQAEIQARLPNWSRTAVVVSVTETAPGDPETNVITLRATMMASSATPYTFVIDTVGDFQLESEVAMRQEIPATGT